MKLSNLILIGLLAYAGWQLAGKMRGESAPAIAFTDVDGKTRDFSKLERPMAVGFWIENCPYCANAMGVLNRVREEQPAGKLDVVGFFLNAQDSSGVSSLGSREGYYVTLAAAQPPNELIAALDSSFHIRGPGRDIYVIDRSGHYKAISTVDGSGERRSPDAIKAEVDARLKEALKKS